MPIRQLKQSSNDQPEHGFSSRLLGGSRATITRSRKKLGLLSSRKIWQPKNAFGFLLRIGLSLCLIGGIFLISLFAWYSKDLPDPNKIIARDIAQSTRIYDRTGEVMLYEIHGAERRTLIELSDIPQYAIDATIAIEDKNFYKHKGLSPLHIFKAVILEVAQKLGLYKGLVPGGSTLTQQFIKNAVLTNEKSYTRKLKEWVLAYRLERKFDKKEILKMYFNEIPYGSTAYGIETAAHIYFDKSAKDLTLAEAATLAAMTQAPSYYSPYGSHKDELIKRQHYVLKLMSDQGYITQDQANEARQQELVFKKRQEDIKAPHFVFYVKEQLSERYGERLVEQGGLKIITTLDAEKQKIAEEVIAEQAPKNAERYNANNVSLVSIDTKTGEIVAMVGSRDYFNDDIDGQVNVATSPRQPGSSLKPLVYAEAFNMGYRPETILFDLETSFGTNGGKEYKPSNYDGNERGPLTMRQALQGSLNIPAVKTLYLVGVNRAVARAQEFGYTTLTNPDRYGLSLVLGGGEVKLLEHTNAYATFAREGVYKPTVSILRVEDISGKILDEHKDNSGKRVMPREVMETLSNVLSDNNARSYIFGASNFLTLAGRPAAAKTGTTNNYKDAWTMGYTPSLATGVWVGNSDGTEMNRGADGSIIAAPIWNKYMNRALQGTPVESFKAPPSPDSCGKPMVCGFLEPETVVRINKANAQPADDFTPPDMIEEKKYRRVHDILHYVDRSDPLGPEPQNPTDDPQYLLWEGPVRSWAESQGYITDQAAPSQPQNPSTGPVGSDARARITQPSDGQILTSSDFALSLDVQSGIAVRKVDYFLDTSYLGTVTDAPYALTTRVPSGFEDGTHRLKAIVTEMNGTEFAVTSGVQIRLTTSVSDTSAASVAWAITWDEPADGTTYDAQDVPHYLRLNITQPRLIAKIDFYQVANGKSSYIGFKSITGQTKLRLAWDRPQTPGAYSVYAVVIDTGGYATTIPGVSFSIR